MAAPVVSGVLALLMQYFLIFPLDIKNITVSSVLEPGIEVLVPGQSLESKIPPLIVYQDTEALLLR